VSSAKEDQLAPLAETSATDAAPRRRRRAPALVLGLGGGAVTMLYGVTVMRLRMSAPLVMLGLGGLTLVLAGIALWRVLDPLSRAEGVARLAPRAPLRLRELEREKQLVLKAIKEIEFDYQTRKVAEPDYKDMIERYRRRAMRLITEIEAGDNFKPLIERELRDRLAAQDAAGELPKETSKETTKESTTASEPTACPACGVRNDDDAQFCKKCGEKLRGNLQS
jgi:hypothetical protein